MIAVDRVDAFLASPIGHCLVRDGYAMWCSSPSLAGLIHWGTLNRAFIADIVDVGSRLVNGLAAPRVVCDFRDLESIHLDDVIAFIDHVRAATLDPLRVGGLTVVVPGGLPGIIVAGAAVALTSVPNLVFAHAPGHDVPVEIEEIAMQARGTGFFVTRVRNHLAQNLSGATIEACATALSTSERTLQRRLRAAGTSFGEQLRRARIDAAWQLVRFSDLKIDAIAARVGFGTASRMGSIFRAQFGLTAAQLRLPAT